MAEIIALIFIARYIGRLAAQKGLNPTRWRIYSIAAWIIFELIGFMVALFIFTPDNLFSIAMVGLMFGVTSFFLIRTKLQNLPDRDIEDDINNIGS